MGNLIFAAQYLRSKEKFQKSARHFFFHLKNPLDIFFFHLKNPLDIFFNSMLTKFLLSTISRSCNLPIYLVGKSVKILCLACILYRSILYFLPTSIHLTTWMRRAWLRSEHLETVIYRVVLVNIHQIFWRPLQITLSVLASVFVWYGSQPPERPGA